MREGVSARKRKNPSSVVFGHARANERENPSSVSTRLLTSSRAGREGLDTRNFVHREPDCSAVLVSSTHIILNHYEASWQQEDVAPELSGPMHWLGSHNALRACVLFLWPSGFCVPPQHPLLARRGSLRAIRVIQHPTLRRILHVEAFGEVGVMSPLPRGVHVLFRSTRPLRSCKWRNTTNHVALQRGRAATKLSNTGSISVHTTSFSPWFTLRHFEGSPFSPFSRRVPLLLPISRDF